MSDEVFFPLFYGILLYLGLFCGISAMASKNFSCFNPKTNYENWYELNWIGVWFFTFMYWIFFFPFTLMALIYWVFTVGRK